MIPFEVSVAPDTASRLSALPVFLACSITPSIAGSERPGVSACETTSASTIFPLLIVTETSILPLRPSPVPVNTCPAEPAGFFEQAIVIIMAAAETAINTPHAILLNLFNIFFSFWFYPKHFELKVSLFLHYSIMNNPTASYGLCCYQKKVEL